MGGTTGLCRLSAAGRAVAESERDTLPKRAAVLRYMRQQLDQHGRVEQYFSSVRRGEPVPEPLMRAFVGYWNQNGCRRPLDWGTHVEPAPAAPVSGE